MTAGGVREVRKRQVRAHPSAKHVERAGEARRGLCVRGVRRGRLVRQGGRQP